MLYLSQCRARRDEAQRATLLEKIIERLRQLDRIVNDMLCSRAAPARASASIADLFRAVHDALAAVKPADAHLVIDGADFARGARGNRAALTAALINLIDNAFAAGADAS